jgi:hypothetical protein
MMFLLPGLVSACSRDFFLGRPFHCFKGLHHLNFNEATPQAKKAKIRQDYRMNRI